MTPHQEGPRIGPAVADAPLPPPTDPPVPPPTDPPVPPPPDPPVLRRVRQRVTMADVDAARVLYYATPYRWREALFTSWLVDLGRPLSTLLEDGTVPPCVTSSARYLRPVRLDDELELTLLADHLGRSSFGLRMDGYDASGEPAVEVHTTNVWTEQQPDGRFVATPLPDWLRSALGGQ